MIVVSGIFYNNAMFYLLMAAGRGVGLTDTQQ